jgi:penicillin-insensitive murein endopeptidase
MRRRPRRGRARTSVRHRVRTARIGRKRSALPALLSGASLFGCIGTPTPLAPGLSGSVGWPHYGVQTGALELPASGDGYCRYRTRDGYYWGQPALVNGIREAARRVQLAWPGGAQLVVGDLSARFGGKIERHNSHRSGRDADLLWYVTDRYGNSVQNPSFVHIAGDGVATIPGRGDVRLDVPREWQLIKALLTSEHLEVQWLYASNLVRSLVLAHASSMEEDPELIRRARAVMSQPAESLSHDDHLHLRIACSPESSAAGCEGGGPYWAWLPAPSWPEPVDAVDAELVRWLEPLVNGGGG